MSARSLLSELDRLGVQLRAEGDRLRYAGPEATITSGLLDRLKAHKPELSRLLAWDEDEAYGLVRDALRHLAEHYVKDADLDVLDPWEDQIKSAYETEDMAALRSAIEGLVRAGLREFEVR